MLPGWTESIPMQLLDVTIFLVSFCFPLFMVILKILLMLELWDILRLIRKRFTFLWTTPTQHSTIVSWIQKQIR